MEPNGHTRVDLGRGHWADIRTINVGDLRAQRKAERERGYTDELEDGIILIPRLVRAWSFGDVVDEDAIDALDSFAVNALAQAMTAGQNDPNVSTPSSDGEGKSPAIEG